MAGVDGLDSLPSFGSLTLIAEEDRLAYWWSDGGATTLRLYDHHADSTERVELESDAFSPSGWEPIHWLGDRFLIQSRPGLFFVDLDGAVEEFHLEEDYTLVVDVDADARRIVYLYYPEGVGPTEEPWTLRLHDREKGETTVLTEQPEQFGHAGFSFDGHHVAYRENPTQTFGAGRIVVNDVDGNRTRTLHVADELARTLVYDWHPDGRRLLVADRSTGWYRPGLYDIETDATRWFGTGQDNEFPLTIMPDGDRLVTVRFRDGTSAARVYPIADPSAGRNLELPRGLIARRVRQPVGKALSAGHVLLKHETSTRPPRLLLYDLRTDEHVTIIDTHTDAVAAMDLVDAEHVAYESTDGLHVHAVLHRPPESPSPAIVKIHGGPTSAVRCGFDADAQALVSHGYTVLQPNYRGSTDQDRGFEAAIRGEEGDGAVDDMAAGARWLAGQEWIDEDRLVAFGHSAGAYNAAMQSIRHPDVWRLVIPENGYLDYVAAFRNPNPYALRRLIDDPDTETEEAYLRERSPVHRADDVDCPICIIHGGRDRGLAMADRFVDGLEERGWTEGEEFRYEVLEHEGHVIQDRPGLWQLLVDVCDQYLTDD